MYFNRSHLPTKVLADRRQRKIHLWLIAAFVAGGVLGALGFKRWGDVTTVPLAVLLGLLVSGPLLHDIRSGPLTRPPAVP